MSKKITVGNNMTKTDIVTTKNWVAQAVNFREINGRKNLPLIVDIRVSVAGNLLSLRRNSTIIISQWVSCFVRVKESRGILVLEGNCIIVVDNLGIFGKWIITKGFLELRAHKSITGTRVDEDFKVDVEPKEENSKGKDNKAKSTGSKVLAKLMQSKTRLDIKQVP